MSESDFDREVQEAFAEVSQKGMPVVFRLNNERLSGVVQSTNTTDHLREAAYENENQIVIVAAREQFSRDPDEYARQTLTILRGAFAGAYTVQGANADAAHYILMAIPTDV